MPSIATITAAGLALASSAHAAYTYSIADQYSANDFMDESKWRWRNSTEFANGDPTLGYINYVNLATAQSKGIAGVADGQFLMQIDPNQSSYVEGSRPNSVRIESEKYYRHFLIVGKFGKFPTPGCGIWPAFWTNGNGEWPKAGEMNMYESWNEDAFNRPALHTGSKDQFGSLFLNAADFSGSILRNDCDNVFEDNDTGCVVEDPGAPYGSADGGVYAIQYETDQIRMWRWTLAESPVDLDTQSPNPDSWGTPAFATPHGQNLDTLFQEQQIILNLDVCGGAPEATWSQSFNGAATCAEITQKATCQEYIQGSAGSIFSDAAFKIHGITVWTSSGNGTDTTTSTAPTQSTTSISSAETTATDITTAEETTTTSSGDSSTPTSESSSVETGSDESCSDSPSTTSRKTIFTTQTSTLTSCEPTVTDCPAAETGAEGTGATGDKGELCTSTVYITSVEVVTSCDQAATACTPGDTTTRTLVSTTVFPTTGSGSSSGGFGDNSGDLTTTSEGTTTATSTTRMYTTVYVSSGNSSPTGNGKVEDGSGGVGGDEGYTNSTGTGTTLAQLSSTVSAGCLSGKACATESVQPVQVAGAGKAAVAGWLMLVVGILFF